MSELKENKNNDDDDERNHNEAKQDKKQQNTNKKVTFDKASIERKIGKPPTKLWKLRRTRKVTPFRDMLLVMGFFLFTFFLSHVAKTFIESATTSSPRKRKGSSSFGQWHGRHKGRLDKSTAPKDKEEQPDELQELKKRVEEQQLLLEEQKRIIEEQRRAIDRLEEPSTTSTTSSSSSVQQETAQEEAIDESKEESTTQEL
eukprot:scaffold2003_cov139-Cylindrotheca_fusiformis.AAC.1